MNKEFKNIVIISAGGKGERLSSEQKKQFIEIGHYCLLDWTILPFLEIQSIAKILITLPEKDVERYQNRVRTLFPTSDITCLAGGRERQESVYLALQQCPADTNLVLIHDGVRPFIKKEDIEAMICQCKTAIIPISAVKYTLKEVKNGNIIKTVPRDDIFEAHTPQIFAYPLIWNYHQEAKKVDLLFTDDASILEYFKEEVITYEISYNNLKITTKDDLEYSKYMLLNRR
jgi:2-C-methyl-D-erythritol 4-phosphate cytidylyltransferase